MIEGVSTLRLGYVTLFFLTAVTCFGVIPRARSRIDDVDTRRGLVSLLALNGLWATFHVGRLIVPSPDVKIGFYIAGLIVGLSTVGAWLYFCSAYASKAYHRNRSFRVAALVVFVAVVSVKLTSPVHGLYFTAAYTTTPFPHLGIRFGLAHWIVTGLAYALSAIGFYILFDLFQESGYATRRLGFLVALAGLPVVFDTIGYVDENLFLSFNYEPVGVGLFALGVLYLADGTFIGVRALGREQLIDELDEAIVLLDRDGVVRDVNVPATDLFPELANSVGTRLETLAPEIEGYLPIDAPRRIERSPSGDTRHFLLSAPQLTVGQTVVGQAAVFTEITQFERQRDEIERQRSRLDDLAEAITHELRNSLNIMQGNIDLARTRHPTDVEGSGLENIETAARMTDRMVTLVGDLATLAHLGQSIESRETVDVESLANQAFASVESDAYELRVDAGTVQADSVRLERVFEKLFSFAIANGATQVELTQEDGVISVTDDGETIESADIEAAFTYGQAVPDSETGMLLPVARTLVDAHGWDITIDPEYQDGIRTVITT